MSRITTEEALHDVSFALDTLRAIKNPSDEHAMAIFNLTDAQYYLIRALEDMVQADEVRYLSVTDEDYQPIEEDAA